jgi:mRNA interferase MazF
VFGEVHICRFPFTEGVTTKVRPVLVLFDLGEDLVICRITTVPHATPCDVALKDWQDAGLLKPSTVRLNRLVTVERPLLKQQLGTLSKADADSVRSVWNQHLML